MTIVRHALILSTAGAVLATAPVGSMPVPTASLPTAMVVRDQPVAAFVRDLFARVGQPVVTSSTLTGTINGTFQGSTEKVFSDVAKAFNLVSYYDGAAIYIYPAKDLTVQTLPVGPAVAARVLAQVRQQRLTDARNMIRSSGDGTLVVSGTPRFVEQVGALAQTGPLSAGGTAPRGLGGATAAAPRLPGGFADPQSLEFRVFYLRYARAEDTSVTAGGRETRVPGLATIIQNLVLDRRPTSQTFGSRPVRASQPRLKGQGLGSVMPNAQQTPLLGLEPGGYYPADGSGEVLGAGDGGASAPLTSDVIRVEANPYTNSVIIRDVPERMASYDSLVRALDVEPQLVEIEATIIDINTDKLRQLGINWRFGSGGFGALFGNGTESDLRLLPTNSSRRDNVTNITPAGAGGTISTIIGSQREFLGRITALETKGVARVVSRPQVLTLSNVEAIFDRTRTFYVRVAGREEVDLFNVTAGTVLRVNPHVFRDQDQTRIRMLVNIEDGSISRDSLVENIPIVERASVSTQAMVLDGESLLLGGMTVDADADSSYKIPLLGDIPLLGNLFKVQQRSRSRTERLFLLTPRLVSLGSRVGPTTVATTTRVAPAPINPKPGFSTDGSIMR